MRAAERAFDLGCQVNVLDGSRRIDLGDDVGDVYLSGCKFELTLSNSGKRPIAITSMRIDLKAEDLQPLAFREAIRGYGAARSAHQLFVEMSRSGFSGWWMLSDQSATPGATRPIGDEEPDIFASPSAPRLRFALEPGESEFIEGAFLATEPGLYTVSIAALASEPGSTPIAKAISPIRLCFAEALADTER